ncbi:MAG: hypothetical protein IJ689_02670 [Alphaproteobacteria bacterium]|nr:hypothetical protein [Alphaproteobacteria bacterium]
MTEKQYAKIIIAAVIAFFLSKKEIYQAVWGQKSGIYPAIGGEKFTDLGDQPWQDAKIGGYDIKYRLRKEYEVSGRVVFIDWNDGIFNTWYHSASNEGVKLYNAVASVDVSIIHGQTAADDNWRKIKFSHEERALFYNYLYKDNPIVNDDEINNNHVIPATTSVRRAIALLKPGDIAYFKGYVMDWRGTGKFNWFEIETAVESGEKHAKILYGGRPGAGLCRQFYVTEINFGGYTFK